MSETEVAGVVLLILVVILTFFGGMAWYVVAKLFAEDHGIVPRVATGHLEFLSSLESAIDQIRLSVEETSKISKKTDSTVLKIQAAMAIHEMNLDRFQRIWKYHVKFLRKLSRNAGFEEDIDEDLQRMEELVNQLSD